jgi:hypothetical protein
MVSYSLDNWLFEKSPSVFVGQLTNEHGLNTMKHVIKVNNLKVGK